MKKLFVVGALMFGSVVMVQAQTTPQKDAPKKDGTRIKEAPLTPNPTTTTVLSRTANTPTTAPSTTQENNVGTNRAVAPGTKVVINGTAPVQTTKPVVKVDTKPNN